MTNLAIRFLRSGSFTNVPETEYRAHRLSRCFGYADAVAIDQFPAFPASKEQDADDDRRQDDAGRQYRPAAPAVAQEDIDDLDDNREHVAAGVPPRRTEPADPRVAQHVGEARDGGQSGEDQPRAEQPHRGLEPAGVAG